MARRPSSDAHRKAVKKYNQENAKAISLTLFKHSEADCLEKLASVDSMRAYLIALIRQDIASEKGRELEKTNTEKINVYGYFQSDELDADGNFSTQVEADRDRLVSALVDVYDSLPQFIRNQVQSLGAANNEVDVDIIELSEGRKLR